MVDDRPEESGPAGETGRPKREPPTIDLQATAVSETPKDAGEAKTETKPETKADEAADPVAPATAETASSEHVPSGSEPVSSPVSPPVSPWAIAPISGAVAAALVIAVGWALGWPTVQTPAPAPQLNAGAIDGLTARVAGLESKVSKPAAPTADPASASRMEAIEKSVAALRSELAAARAQTDKLAAGLNDVKSAPRDSATTTSSAVDLSAVNERIAQIERAAKAQDAEISGIKAAEAKPVESKPADDAALRRVVAASLLDVSVRHGDPYAAQLAAAKSLAGSADALKPLEAFAASGVPSAPALCRDLVAIVPKLAPPAADAETTGSSVIDRLQAGAAKLVRVQRADAVGNDRGSIVARVTAAALRNDVGEARRELVTLAPADRAAAQDWLAKADARDAALAASGKFSTDAMTALAAASK
jgi:hypothetical protein